MFSTSLSVLDSKPAVINSILALAASVVKFRDYVSGIRSVATEQVTDTRGIAQDKLLNKNKLAHSAAIVAAALKAYAHTIKNSDLEKMVSCKEKSMLKSNDNMLIEKSDIIAKKGQKHLTELADYGVEAANITTLNAHLDLYLQKYNDPTLAIEKRKSYTKKLTSLFSQASDILRNEIDPLMYIVSNTDADLYELYLNARVTIDRHGKSHEHKVAEGIGDISTTVLASFDGSAIEGSTLELVQNEEVVATIETDELGEGYFENVPAGNYQVRATQTTYIPKLSEEISVEPGDDIEVELMLEASLE